MKYKKSLIYKLVFFFYSEPKIDSVKEELSKWGYKNRIHT